MMRLAPYTSSRPFVTPLMVKEYVYCPAIPWIQWNYGVEPEPTPSMEEGSGAKVPRLSEVADEVGLPEPRRFELFIVDRVHGVSGRVDAVGGSCRRGFEVLEYKAFPRRRVRHFRAQLLVYMLMVNTVLGPVRKGHLVVGDRHLVIEATEEVLGEAEQLVEATKRVIHRPDPPPVHVVEAKCSYCLLRKVCPVRSGVYA